ncbi:hypothetical protein [Nocardia crassostreae]|uniref:hypothetical protein n=1 Tax=Nocardia crassostreae TaxID=53428 RepID=UPI000835FED0|nr:hypothetical protein [Nocardia crassostreae]
MTKAVRTLVTGAFLAVAAVASVATASADAALREPAQPDATWTPINCDPNNWNQWACLLSGSSSLSAKR